MYDSLGPRGGGEMDPHNKCMGGRVWCVSDICGIICAVMTWLLVTYAEFVVVTVVVGTANYPIYTTFNLLLFNVFAVLALSSHTRAMFTDPVSVPGGSGETDYDCRECVLGMVSWWMLLQ